MDLSSRQALEEYYSERAPEYHGIYGIPGWQDDLCWLRNWVAEQAVGKTVLELAAGSGYWTVAAARVAQHVTAIDCSKAMLDVAAQKEVGANVELIVGDAYSLPRLTRTFDMAMAHLWWSHVGREHQGAFLSQLSAVLRPNAPLLMLDQSPGSARDADETASRWDRHGNRYELRMLADGRIFEIMKNYPSDEDLRNSLATASHSIQITRLRHFWALSARMGKPS